MNWTLDLRSTATRSDMAAQPVAPQRLCYIYIIYPLYANHWTTFLEWMSANSTNVNLQWTPIILFLDHHHHPHSPPITITNGHSSTTHNHSSTTRIMATPHKQLNWHPQDLGNEMMMMQHCPMPPTILRWCSMTSSPSKTGESAYPNPPLHSLTWNPGAHCQQWHDNQMTNNNRFIIHHANQVSQPIPIPTCFLWHRIQVPCHQQWCGNQMMNNGGFVICHHLFYNPTVSTPCPNPPMTQPGDTSSCQLHQCITGRCHRKTWSATVNEWNGFSFIHGTCFIPSPCNKRMKFLSFSFIPAKKHFIFHFNSNFIPSWQPHHFRVQCIFP